MDDGMELLKAAEAEIQTPHVQDLFHEDAQVYFLFRPFGGYFLMIWDPDCTYKMIYMLQFRYCYFIFVQCVGLYRLG